MVISLPRAALDRYSTFVKSRTILCLWSSSTRLNNWFPMIWMLLSSRIFLSVKRAIVTPFTSSTSSRRFPWVIWLVRLDMGQTVTLVLRSSNFPVKLSSDSSPTRRFSCSQICQHVWRQRVGDRIPQVTDRAIAADGKRTGALPVPARPAAFSRPAGGVFSVQSQCQAFGAAAGFDEFIQFGAVGFEPELQDRKSV